MNYMRSKSIKRYYDMEYPKYCVCFKRKDNRSDELYYYHTVEDAREHFNLFVNDDSDLYVKIILCDAENDIPIDTLTFHS